MEHGKINANEFLMEGWIIFIRNIGEIHQKSQVQEELILIIMDELGIERINNEKNKFSYTFNIFNVF